VQGVLIPAELRTRLRELRFTARHPAFGLGWGQHPGRSRGAGLEFEQYRAYEPGDEPRRVDWKLYARSDRFFVREAARDSPLSVWVLLDASASMSQADAARPAYSKFAAAKLLAACLAEVATLQGDSCGVASLSSAGIAVVPSGSGPRHRDRVWLALERLSAQGAWPDEAQLAPLWERLSPETVVVILSDGFDAALPVFATGLAAARRQVYSLGLISCEERDFPFEGGYVFVDPETGAECRSDAQATRTEFLARFRAARAQLARQFARSGIRHVDHCLDEAPDVPLRQLLARA
jgi:uncharacterized protein (DUF58 family)